VLALKPPRHLASTAAWAIAAPVAADPPKLSAFVLTGAVVVPVVPPPQAANKRGPHSVTSVSLRGVGKSLFFIEAFQSPSSTTLEQLV